MTRSPYLFQHQNHPLVLSTLDWSHSHVMWPQDPWFDLAGRGQVMRRLWNIGNHKCISCCCSGETLHICLSVLIIFRSWWIPFNVACIINSWYLMDKSALIFSELNELYFLSYIPPPLFFPYTQFHFINFGDKIIRIQLVRRNSFFSILTRVL